jgi:hypothetical protein
MAENAVKNFFTGGKTNVIDKAMAARGRRIILNFTSITQVQLII